MPSNSKVSLSEVYQILFDPAPIIFPYFILKLNEAMAKSSSWNEVSALLKHHSIIYTYHFIDTKHI